MKKRIFQFKTGLPEDAETMQHVLICLGHLVGKDAPDAFQGAHAEVIVRAADRVYHAETFIELADEDKS